MNVSRLFDILERAAGLWPEKKAVVFKDKRMSYKELDHRVNCLAKGLLKSGVKKGDHVSVLQVNSVEWFYSEYALGKIG
ncbi:MAG: AMP-binding protein, partial [Thermodesulfobacteriota bacterium]|nr:AMP-binding protein [Thermodesulfobacteriota bacterium]